MLKGIGIDLPHLSDDGILQGTTHIDPAPPQPQHLQVMHQFCLIQEQVMAKRD